MGFIELAILAARSLSIVVNNPVLGGGSSQSLQDASGLLVIFADLLEEGEEAYDELKAFTAVVKAMADEGRGPNREERDFLAERRRITHEGYQAEKERILGEAQEEQRLKDEAEAEEQRLKEEAEAEERRLKEEAIKTDLARLSDEDLQFNAAEAGVVLTEGMERAEIEALILKARLEE